MYLYMWYLYACFERCLKLEPKVKLEPESGGGGGVTCKAREMPVNNSQDGNLNFSREKKSLTKKNLCSRGDTAT